MKRQVRGIVSPFATAHVACMRRSLGRTCAAWVVVVGLAAGTARAACVGDCDGDGEVSVVEIVRLVNVALGNTPLESCTAGDENGDGQVTIDEIVHAVGNVFQG